MVRQTRQLVHQPRQLSAIDIRQNSISPESSPLPSKKPDTATLYHPSVEIRTAGANLSQKSKPSDRSFFSILSRLLGIRMSTPSSLFVETVTAASSQASAISGSSSSHGRTWFSNWYSHTPHESSRRKDEIVDLEMNQHFQVVDEAEYDRRQYHKKDGQKTGRTKARGCLIFCKTFWGRRKIWGLNNRGLFFGMYFFLFFACWEWGSVLGCGLFFTYFIAKDRSMRRRCIVLFTPSLEVNWPFLSVCNYHSSWIFIYQKHKSWLYLAFWSLRDGWSRDYFYLERPFEFIWYIHTIKTNPPCST